MKVLVLGSGGREHALAWALARSASITEVISAPGNAGMAGVGPCVALDPSDAEAVDALCASENIDLVVVGPEDPLVKGVADILRAKGRLVVGPSAKAAQLEGSKSFTKDLCTRMGIPTARHETFSDATGARDYAASCELPIVVKADGLAAGKGVIIAETRKQVTQAVEDMVSGRFGEAGAVIVFEEFLQGEEASFFALTDGKTILPLVGAQDHKRAFDGDKGPNTGGMGAYSPAPVFDEAMQAHVMAEIIEPTVRGMAEIGAPFQGVLYAGLMIGPQGPKLIEYNVRFGDPEAQVLMPRLEGDLGDIFLKLAQGRLDEAEASWRDEVALTVVMAAKGYPGSYEKGSVIQGLDAAADLPGVVIFHAGTKPGGGSVLANGGRVLNITALGKDVAEAQARAYAAIERIDWPEGFCRKDIGWRAVKRAS